MFLNQTEISERLSSRQTREYMENRSLPFVQIFKLIVVSVFQSIHLYMARGCVLHFCVKYEEVHSN